MRELLQRLFSELLGGEVPPGVFRASASSGRWAHQGSCQTDPGLCKGPRQVQRWADTSPRSQEGLGLCKGPGQ
eukprot:12918930-Prorocentrum_lima.AAC.1